MQSERLRDTNEDWGLSPAEYARREKIRMRDRMKKRAQRARMKMEPPPLVPVDNIVQKLVTFRLKGKDVQELGIIAVVSKVSLRPDPMSHGYNRLPVPMSLPYVSILYGHPNGADKPE